MANAQAICTSFKVEILKGIHALATTVARGGTTADTLKAALFQKTATQSASTTAYGTSGEMTGTGYTAGGVTVTNGTAPSSTSTTAFWTPSASFQWTGFTSVATFDAVLIYNSTQGDKAIGVFTFGDQSVTSGTFTLTMPTNDSSTGLIRLA